MIVSGLMLHILLLAPVTGCLQSSFDFFRVNFRIERQEGLPLTMFPGEK